MPRELVITGPFITQFMTWIFIFSTLYTLAYYYYQGEANTVNYNGIADNANDFKNTGIIGTIDKVLDFISWISPFALVKGLVIVLLKDTPEIYEFLNLIFLRPMSWTVAFITVNYLKTWIPTLGRE